MITGCRGVKWTGISNSFAGGIFLGVGMLHMLPEAHEVLEHTFPDFKLPLAFVLMLCGYSLILMLERVICNVHKHEPDKKCYIAQEMANRSTFDSEAEEMLFKNVLSRKV